MTKCKLTLFLRINFEDKSSQAWRQQTREKHVIERASHKLHLHIAALPTEVIKRQPRWRTCARHLPHSPTGHTHIVRIAGVAKVLAATAAATVAARCATACLWLCLLQLTQAGAAAGEASTIWAGATCTG